MLNDASGFRKIYLATGYTDLRRGMEGLANIIRFRFHLDPYDRNTCFFSVAREQTISKDYNGLINSCWTVSVHHTASDV